MITNTKITLSDKKLADATNDYAWQTDPELARLDGTSPLTMPFPRYLADYASILRYPYLGRYSFAIETRDGKHIGNCTYYHIDETRGEAELGIMIGHRNYWDKGYGTAAVTALISHIFRQTNLKRIYLKTLDSNHRAQQCFQKCGFTPCGHEVKDGYDFVLMELHRKQWSERQTNA